MATCSVVLMLQLLMLISTSAVIAVDAAVLTDVTQSDILTYFIAIYDFSYLTGFATVVFRIRIIRVFTLNIHNLEECDLF